MSIPEAMEYLNDLKLHQQELEEETKRLRHQQDRLEEELRLLEDAVKQKIQGKKQTLDNIMKSLQKCDGCGATGVPLETSMYGNPEYCESSGDFCKDCR